MSEAADALVARYRPELVERVELVQEGAIVLAPARGRSFVDRADGFMIGLVRAGDLLLDDAGRWAHFRIVR